MEAVVAVPVLMLVLLVFGAEADAAANAASCR